MDSNQQTLITFLILGAVQVWSIIRDWLSYQRSKESSEQSERKELHDNLREAYERARIERDEKNALAETVRKHNEELERQITELSKQNKSELIHCIAEQDILIESLRKDMAEVTADRDFWREFVNKKFPQETIRNYKGD